MSVWSNWVLTSEHGPVEHEVVGRLDQPDIGGYLLATGELDDIAHHEIFGGDGLRLAVAKNDSVFRQKVEDGRHDALCRPVLESSEERLEEDDDNDHNGKC